MCPTLECFGASVSYLIRNPKPLSLHLKFMKVFFLGYGSNEHAYRVFNKTSRRVEIAADVTFDESNGS